MNINYESPSSRLDILQYLSSLHHENLLKDYYLIGCQHLLPSTHLMMRSFFDMGIKPERTALIGKCYSTSPKTVNLMRNEGIYVCPTSAEFDSHQSYDDQFQKNIFEFYKNIINHLKIPSHAKIIVLDDGGELLSVVNNTPTNFERIIGVEQTSSGFHKLDKMNLKIPIMNVARSSAKLTVESLMIVEGQTQNIVNAIKSLELSPKKVLVIGNGSLGNYLTSTLPDYYGDVSTYDTIANRSDFDKKNLVLSTFDLIIGTTGECSLPLESNTSSLKKDVILASVSSSDREFGASYLRKKTNQTHCCHENLSIDNIHLLNCGFPVNFQGADEDTIPLEKIQLTIALLFSAACQGGSLEDLNSGLISLDSKSQKMILSEMSLLELTYNMQSRNQETKLLRGMAA